MADSRTVVITGVSRGLGKALLDGFASRGQVVHGCARSATAIDQLAHHYPAPNSFSTVDVAHDEEVRQWADQLIRDCGPPDLLINNAATINANASLWRVPSDEFSSVVDINVKGVFHTIRHFVPAMIDAGRGVIVNMSSGWGRSASPDVGPYCATKWAIEGLTKALAEELPDGMAAVPLNPGIIHTEMLDSCYGERAASYPEPARWALSAVPFLLRLGPQDNGKSLTVTLS